MTRDASDGPFAPARWNFAILTHGQLAATQRCLRSLAATVRAPFRVFVVDNASTDATPAWLRSRTEPWLHWRLNGSNRGVPGGRNDLLAFALPHLRPDDWLVFCDNDLEFGPGWLDAFAAAMHRYPDARLLGKVGHFVTVREHDRLLAPAAAVTGPVDVLSGGYACMVRGDAAAAIGPFDEELGLFWHEDDDWCVRALQLGLEVVAVPEAHVVHHEHATGVATAGLREGGSRRNMQYLVAKWRRHGWIDDAGWVRRANGCYQPPAVRAELQRAAGRATPLGRAEFAAAFLLLERLVSAADPAAEFAARREPVPACFGAMLRANATAARAVGADDLVRRLEIIGTVVEQLAFGRQLRPLLATPAPAPGIRVGHGLCAAADFDDPAWLRQADALDPLHGSRDPHARDRVFWEQVSLLLVLERHGALRPGVRVLLVGEPRERLRERLLELGLDVDGIEPGGTPRPADVVVIDRALAPDAVAAALSHARADALVALVGDCVLNGAPRIGSPVPLQLQHDLLARAGLEPLEPVRTDVDERVLDGCVDAPDGADHRWPHLCRLVGNRLMTSFVVAGRRQPRASVRAAVVVPAAPPRTVRATVGVDLRTIAYADSSARGIGHYTVHHLAAVARLAPDLRLRCFLPAAVELPSALQLPNVQRRDVDDWTPEAVDLMHLPDPMNMTLGFDSPLRVFRHPQTTVTFHDLTPLQHYLPMWPPRNREAYLDRLRQLRHSDAHLLCNSRFTAEHVTAELGRDPTTVTAILAGLHGGRGDVAPAARAEVRRRLGLRGPFVAHVGALDLHKNFSAALSAFLQVRGRRPLQLVVTGSVDGGIEHFADYVAARRIPDVVFTGYLPRRDLDALYAEASALVFLSKSEGFGFPLLEAMAAGCPVVASDATSHPEVTGDAGILVPLDGAAAHAAAAIGRLLDDPPLAERCRKRGRDRAAAFTWDAVAERTLAVWRAMLGGVGARSDLGQSVAASGRSPR